MLGTEPRMHRLPETLFPCSSTPSLFKRTGSTPKKGLVANSGLGAELSGDGLGAINMPPVSRKRVHNIMFKFKEDGHPWSNKLRVPVCHHVSTTVHRSSPTTSLYQCQASALIGSPTGKETVDCKIVFHWISKIMG